MSANQIPTPFPAPRDRSRGHSCPFCWMNGGPGHTLAEVARLRRVVEEGRARLYAQWKWKTAA